MKKLLRILALGAIINCISQSHAMSLLDLADINEANDDTIATPGNDSWNIYGGTYTAPKQGQKRSNQDSDENPSKKPRFSSPNEGGPHTLAASNQAVPLQNPPYNNNFNYDQTLIAPSSSSGSSSSSSVAPSPFKDFYDISPEDPYNYPEGPYHNLFLPNETDAILPSSDYEPSLFESILLSSYIAPNQTIQTQEAVTLAYHQPSNLNTCVLPPATTPSSPSSSSSSSSVEHPSLIAARIVLQNLANNQNIDFLPPAFIPSSSSSSSSSSSVAPSNRQGYSNNLVKQEKERKEESFVCTYPGCNKVFSQKKDRTEHKRTHKTCAYPGCNMTFSRIRDQQRHMCTHRGEKPFKCTHPGCDKAFSLQTNLTTHMRIHTGEKPFKCKHSGCNKAFAQKGNLTAHLNTHTGKKPYVCKHSGCNKAFGDPGSLTKHKRTHTV